jgi:uncharacterized protein YkwD
MIRIQSRYWKRKTGIVLATILFWVVLVPSQAAQNCARPISTEATILELPAGPIDQNLFSAAVLGQVNYHRCVDGQNPIGPHEGLNEVAKNHAIWMATESRLSHASTIAGESTVSARVVLAVASPLSGSENIGYVHRYRVDEGEMFFAGPDACSFTTKSGIQIRSHSYESMAQRIVDLWMASPGHRQNVLDNRFTVTGSAASYDGNAPYCGVYYLAQDFAG